MAVTEAQKRATAKYRQEHQLLLSYRLPKDLVETFRATAKERGDSQGSIIRAAVEKYIASVVLSEAAGERLSEPMSVYTHDDKSSLRLTERTTEALQAKAESMHITAGQLADAIIADWLTTHE